MKFNSSPFVKSNYLITTAFVLLVLLVLCLSGYFYFSSESLTWGVLAFFLGAFYWTLFEYLINKTILHDFHLNNRLYHSIISFHEKHHDNPQLPKYLAIHPALIIFGLSMNALLGLLLFNWIMLPFSAGFILGYGYFIFLHFAQHHFSLNSDNLFFYSWQRHFLHHKTYPTKALGVSTAFWDIIFGTEPPKHLFAHVDPSTIIQDKKYTVEVVSTKKQQSLFIELPNILYANDPNWISPINEDVEKIFDPETNVYFKRGVARRWIVLNESNEVVGRVAAFLDFNKMYEGANKIGRIGFFESINDLDVANLLLNTCTTWMKENYQINEIEGPVNFGENDKFWGLLIEGFTSPSYGMNYNPSYYKFFFEQYGFVKHYEQLTNVVDLRRELPDRFRSIANRVCQNSRYKFVHFTNKEKKKFVTDFVAIYNEAWKDFHHFQPLSEEYVENSFGQLKPVIVERFIWFAYVDEEPAGLMVAIPDVNEALRYMNGKMNLLGKLKFQAFKTFVGFSKVRVIIMGIKPQFQRLGLESGLILNAFQAGKSERGYKFVQLAWVGDFNKKMIAIHTAMNAIPETKHATYRMKLK